MSGEVHKRIDTLSIWWDLFQSTIEVFLIRGKVNAVIDSGPPQTTGDTITSVLNASGLNPADVDFVLNTHGHFDHIGGNAALKAAGRAQLLIHREDAVFLEDQGRCFDQFYAPFYKAVAGEQSLPAAKEAFLKDMAPELAVDRKL